MMKEMKTVAEWIAFTECTGEESVSEYLHIGDLVPQEFMDMLVNWLPVKIQSEDFLQFEESNFFVRDSLSRVLTPIYLTFAKCEDDSWYYYGFCAIWETVNRSWKA